MCHKECVAQHCVCDLPYIVISGSCVQISEHLARTNYDIYIANKQDVSPTMGMGLFTDCLADWSYCDGIGPPCYPNHQRCHFLRSAHGDASHCPNTEHLRYCVQHECPTMFKCNASYCIPFYMVCDGVPDCPYSEDEVSCSAFSCPGLLKCKSDNICVHPYDICDGTLHCKNSLDDELFCDSEACPLHCQCSGYTVVCFKTNFENLNLLTQKTHAIIFREVNFYVSSISRFIHLVYLVLMNCNVLTSDHDLYPYKNLHNLLHLDISLNKIRFLQAGVFDGLTRLTHINLKGNKIHKIYKQGLRGLESIEIITLRYLFIKSIETCAFCSLQNVKVLDLSQNLLTTLHDIGLTSSPNLQVLNLTSNPLISINSNALENLHDIVTLETSVPAVCCHLPLKSVCKIVHQNSELQLNCNQLFPSRSLLIIAWISILIIISLNVFIISYYVVIKAHKLHFTLIQHLAFCDLLYAIYLLLMCYFHTIYGEAFYIKRYVWLQSLICKVISLVFIVPVMVSNYTSCLISINTLLLTKFALKLIKFTNAQIVFLIMIGWLVSTLIVLPFIIVYQSNSAMCIFSFSFRNSIVLKIVIIGVCVIMCVISSGIHYIVVSFVKESSKRIRKTKTTNTFSMSVKFIGIFIVNTTTIINLLFLLNANKFKDQTILYILIAVMPNKTIAHFFIYSLLGMINKR